MNTTRHFAFLTRQPCRMTAGAISLLVFGLALGAASKSAIGAVLDTVRPDDTAHALSAERVAVVHDGTAGETGWRLLPGGSVAWRGGTLAFTIAVDPERPTYLTVRLSGDDATDSRLVLFCEGRQVGYLHLGDVDVLNTPNGRPMLRGRFVYVTTPLPKAMTQGKTKLACEIRSFGRIWGYGTNFDQYQKPMTEPTVGLYGIYTHTDGFFVPPAAEKQGHFPADPPRRNEEIADVLPAVDRRVNDAIDRLLADKKPPDQASIYFLARAYFVKSSHAFQNPEALRKVVSGIDLCAATFNAAASGNDTSLANADWVGLGPIGLSVSLLAKPLSPQLTQQRRDAWTPMLISSRDEHRMHRRQYTNQTMISDTYGIYGCNRGVAVLRPESALPESVAKQYLYESAGLTPWLGDEKDGKPQKPLGDAYFQLTSKGLTKELGFVGYYGEVLDWMTVMYEVTRPAPGLPGDEKLRAQLIKAAKARAAFRYPGLDPEGNRAMLAETIVGWRDEDHYPGDVLYGQRATWEADPFESAAATLDPTLLGYAQQMLDDGQYGAVVREQLKITGLRTTAGLLSTRDHYEAVCAAPPSDIKLPMSGEAAVFFADEEDGVVAVKHGDEFFYASVYWRARNAVNGLARVHYITPAFDRIAIVNEQTNFQPSGQTYTRPNWVNFGFGNGGLKYPETWDSAHAGETLPIARIPAGVPFKPGDESVYAGRSDFYTLRYGPYLIAMNCSADRSFSVDVPAEGAWTNLATGHPATAGHALNVPALSTAVLYVEPH